MWRNIYMKQWKLSLSPSCVREKKNLLDQCIVEQFHKQNDEHGNDLLNKKREKSTHTHPYAREDR